MSRRISVIKRIGALFVAFVLGIALFVHWQLTKLDSAIQGFTVAGADKLALGAIAPIVVDTEAYNEHKDGSGKASAALLELSADQKDTLRNRAAYVRTWLNAGLIAQDFRASGIKAMSIAKTKNLNAISADHRVDGWSNPYCVAAIDDKVIVFSSGDEGAPNCIALSAVAASLVKSVPDSRLRKVFGRTLVTVQPLQIDSK
jgi:hypothetical protein